MGEKCLMRYLMYSANRCTWKLADRSMLGQRPELEFQPGTLLANRYEVVRFLSSGGMGSVVLVRDKSLQNTLLVLKFLHTSHSLDQQQFLRFQNEALLMRELNHPHIVHIYDYGCIDDSFYYLSMEYIAGMTLGQLIKEHPEGFDFKQSLEILFQMAVAISFAHGRGIVHRDLKPDNILLDLDGDVHVSDFGLGKSVAADLNLTDTGHAVGTPHYMAPEQLRGERPLFQTDVYSFGLVAFELVTGNKAFNSETYLGLAQKHLRDPIPQFATKQSGIPRWFQDFVEKCSAKSPAARFANFGEVAEVLAANIPATKRSVSYEPHVYGSSTNLTHWRLKWQLRKPKRLAVAIIMVLAVVLGTTTIIVGRNNQEVRQIYGSSFYRIEKLLGLDSVLLRTVVLGDGFAETRQDANSLIDRVGRADTDALRLLFDAGMNPNIRTNAGETLVQYAISRGQGQSLVVLAEYGADFTVEDDQRRTTLILATLSARSDIVATVIASMPERLFDIDAADSSGKTALHYATQIANVALVDLLLKEGASPHAHDKEGTTPLMYAARSGNPEIISKILTKTGSSAVNIPNDSKQTPLHFAARSGSTRAVEMLLRYDVDLTSKDRSGLTPLQVAEAHGHSEVVSLLKSRME